MTQRTTLSGGVQALHLSKSPDLICMNLMCQKLGQPCVCRLNVALEKLAHLHTLDLSSNNLPAVPDMLRPKYQQHLRHLDLSNNNIQEVPPELVDFHHLEVRVIL